MLAAVRSAAVFGIEAYHVTVEVDAANGLPQFTVVGLPAAGVKESRERVGAALVNSGFRLPPRRITVNLAPADTRKDGTAFDLPIALGVLAATGQLPIPVLRDRMFVGELGLDGALRPVRGLLPIACLAGAAGDLTLVLPPGNVAEAALLGTLVLAAPATLGSLIDQLRVGALQDARLGQLPIRPAAEVLDFADVAGQGSAKRALEVAAAGGHNIIMIGPPGAGKTMLARRVPGVLPALTQAEALEATAIHSVAGILPPGEALMGTGPFRAPHHSISDAGLIGGGNPPRPGEVSLAHHGVLFLDELLEFRRHVIEGLRQPMEDGRVVIARAACSVAFPARFTLVGATNPCPCGHAGEPAARCVCATSDVARYRARLSAPLHDRIDLHVRVPAVPVHLLGASAGGERSAAVRERVERARVLQRARYRGLPGATANAHASGRWLAAHGGLSPEARTLLVRAAERMAFTARGYHRVLRLARTIADLDESPEVAPPHIAEALHYRPTMISPPGGAPDSLAAGAVLPS